MAVSVRRAVGARRRRSRAGAVPLVLLVLGVLGGCGLDDAQSPPPEPTAATGSRPSGTPDGAAEPEPPSPTQGEVPGPPVPTTGGDGSAPPTEPGGGDLESFLADCERGIREWRAAQVDYPSELTIELGGEESYVAAVDASETPLTPSQVIPGPSPTGEAVFVRCEVAARLTPLGRALTVDDDEWIVRSFTPTGVIRWSWVVTAVEADDQDLRLELQPAVRSEDGTILVGQSSTEISSFITHVRVEDDAVAQVGDWWESTWATIALIAAGVGAAVLAVLRFSAQLAQQLRRTVAAFRGPPPGTDDETDGDADADEPGDVSDRAHHRRGGRRRDGF